MLNMILKNTSLRPRHIRFFSSSRIACNIEPSVKTIPFNPRHLGVANDIYIPTSYKKLPSVFFSPIVVGNALIRRIYTFGLNTFQVAIFRLQSGIKPKFKLWKNKAIENYVRVNKSFSERNIDFVKPNVSIWVEEALEIRIAKLPKKFKLMWDIVKFNSVPKLVSVQAIMVPGRPLEILQLVYKFDSKQRLIKYDLNSGKSEKLDRNVVDYIAYVCDASTDEMILAGSLFESDASAKIPKNINDDTKFVIEKMKVNGDLYRRP